MREADPDPLFRTALTVRVSDLNYGGHLGNDRVVAYFHELRVRWLATRGWTESAIEGVGILQTELQVRYRQQAFLGERLEGTVRLLRIQSRGFELGYHLRRLSDDVPIAEGTTALRFFDYERQEIARTPAAFAALAPS